MLLIIPVIEIKNGKSVHRVHGKDGSVLPDDPIELAKLWRQENAKSLHVTDVDGALQGRIVNFDVIREMVSRVDIPIELGGGFRTVDEVKKAFDAGIYRVVVGTMLIEHPEYAQQILETFGGSKLVLGIDIQNNIVMTKGMTKNSGLTPLSVALNAKEMGFRRIIYRDVLEKGLQKGPNFAAIKMMAEKTGLHVTVSGGIAGLEDLLKLQEIESSGVDSVIIGRAFYENKFSCQHLWRLCEAGQYPYTAKV
jgi:phosphoribosylformimino-5-aminoimidazole carboxamide ribotide isomerase